MFLSIFLLGLFVFLQSAVLLKWFVVDDKLLGFVGIAFVVVLILEALLFFSGRWNGLRKPQ